MASSHVHWPDSPNGGGSVLSPARSFAGLGGVRAITPPRPLTPPSSSYHSLGASGAAVPALGPSSPRGASATPAAPKLPAPSRGAAAPAPSAVVPGRSRVSPSLLAPAPAEVPSAFAFFDADRDGLISFSEALSVYRACGFLLTAAEVAQLSRAVRDAYGGSLTLASCVALAGTLASRATPSSAAVASALESLDTFRGRTDAAGAAAHHAGAVAAPLPLRDLHRLLTGTGDRLSQHEFLSLARTCSLGDAVLHRSSAWSAAGSNAVGGGEPTVNIRALVSQLIAPAPAQPPNSK